MVDVKSIALAIAVSVAGSAAVALLKGDTTGTLEAWRQRLASAVSNSNTGPAR